jgi:carboxyl-terminal processing protease
MPLRRTAAILIFFFLAALRLHAQPAPAPAADRISLEERAWIASKIYSSIQLYFGHWQAVPELDLDVAYRQYLAQALASDDRRAFDLATMEFVARLQNGHSGFWDDWLDESEPSLGFMLATSGGRWVVVRSRTDALAVGDVVRLLDGQPIAGFIADRLRYVAGSSEEARHRLLFFRRFLFPRAFTLTLEDGRAIRIDRDKQTLKPAPEIQRETRMLDGGVAYLRLPSFEKREDQLAAVEFLRGHTDAKAVVIDVRGNGGGTTPSDLISALMDRPYQDFAISTSAYIALFGAYGQVLRTVPADQLGERQKGVLEGLSAYERPQLLIPGSLQKPENPIYKGPVILLADGGCGSACEDFLMPFKMSGRARILGEPSSGSTGQPFYYEFGNGMGFRVSTKRSYFPDGSQFEGVGIRPDVEMRPTVDDLRKGRDPVLDRALEMARGR